MITNLQFFSKLKILTLLFISINFYVSAQTDITKVPDEKKSFFSSFDLGADFKSRYILRGINLGGNTVSSVWSEIHQNSNRFFLQSFHFFTID